MIRISTAATTEAAASLSRRNFLRFQRRHATSTSVAFVTLNSNNKNNNNNHHQQLHNSEKHRQQQQKQLLFSRRTMQNGRSSRIQLFSSCSFIHRSRSYSFTTTRSSSMSTATNDVHHIDENDDDDDNDGFFAPNIMDFESMGITSPVLLQRLQAMGLQRPTAVQAAAFQAMDSSTLWSSSSRRNTSGNGGSIDIQDVTIGSETGSGKTLAYLLPLVNDILERKAAAAAAAASSPSTIGLGYDYARAIILVPNKELVQQLVRMALPLAGGPSSLVYGNFGNDASLFKGSSRNADNDVDGNNIPSHERVRLAIFPGGLSEPLDFQPFRQRLMMGGRNTATVAEPVDLIISTPAALGPLGLNNKNIDMFADIPTLVVDEADMLLDGGYLRDLENVLLGFRRADRLVNAVSWGPKKSDNGDIDEDSSSSSSIASPSSSSFMGKRTQHVFVAATLPDFGLRSVDAYLQKRFPRAVRVTMAGMHQARHSGLQSQTVWIEEESKKGRMQQLAEMLKTTSSPQNGSSSSSSSSKNGLLGAKVMVFLNSVDDVEGASQALSRAGINALPYHAKLPLEERTKTLDRFRKYKNSSGSSSMNDNKKQKKNIDEDGAPVAVLVCTDLAARGLDVPGVDVVVQLQFATNVVSHLHRMGRCGRRVLDATSNDNHNVLVGEGRGIVFYGSTEKHLVRVVQKAEEQQESMVLEGAEVDPAVEEDEGKDGEGVDSNTATAEAAAGSVKDAFSRKRGFTKKLKKLKREAVTEGGGGSGGSLDT
jgi:superfamily II DNA/RNA helicase